jgi:Endonuclease-reverse transcriptase
LVIEINLLLWNCEGLARVCDRMGSIFEKYDVIMLTETFLRKEQSLPGGFYSEHCFASQKKRGRPIGGISIYYKAKLGKLQSKSVTPRFVILNFQNLTIVGSYLNPKMSRIVLDNELRSTIKHISSFQNLIFAGDFNCRLDKKSNKIKVLMDFAIANNLKLANLLPFQSTYVCKNGSSVIDLILLGSKTKRLAFEVQDCKIRKHNIVTSKICVQILSEVGNGYLHMSLVFEWLQALLMIVFYVTFCIISLSVLEL